MVDHKARLQLGKVSMKNYKSYHGEVGVELSRDPLKTVTMIEGSMGKGKTTFLGAIYWCLYGKEKPGTSTKLIIGILKQSQNDYKQRCGRSLKCRGQ